MKFPKLTISVSLFSITLGASEPILVASLSDDMAQATQLATQSNQNIDYQPFILSILHSDDLIKFGVRTLGEALTLVAGIDMATNTMNNRTPIFRGSNPTAYGQSTLVIDGFVQNNTLAGDYNGYLDMPIELIDRIEVVRGSGSFLEGINGYAGTINVLTKSKYNEDNTQQSSVFAIGGSNGLIGAGGWSSYQGNEWKLSLDVFGQRDNLKTPVMVKDALPSFISPADYAHLGMRQIGAGLSYTYKNFELQGRINQYQGDSAFGNLNILPDSDGVIKQPSWYLQGKYNLQLNQDTDLTLKTSIMEDTWESNARSLPPGTYAGITYPDGYWAHLMLKNRRLSGGAALHYNGLDSHYISAGIESTWSDVVDIQSITTNKITGSGMVDYTNTPYSFIDNKNAKRQSTDFYLSDNIDINDNLALAITIGAIKTSDVQSSMYGRVASVYQPNYSDIFKVMVSEGTRYPSDQEMYIAPSLYGSGNPNLINEKVHSIEGQYLRKLNTNLTAGISLFYIQNIDQITLDQNKTFQNLGENKTTGGEAELRGNLTNNDTILLSYSYLNGQVKTIDGETSDLPYSASHLIKAAYAYDLNDNLTVGGIWHYVGCKKRSIDDTRKELKAYQTLDLSMGWKLNHSKGYYFQAIIDNIGNTIVRYPSPASTYPDDYAVSGRSFWFRTGWRF
jgi:iron complex outermembrane receptor protein